MTGLRIGEHPWRTWEPSRRNLPEILRHAAATAPQRHVLTLGDRHYTATDLLTTAARTATTLRDLGATPGSRIALLSPNRAEIVELLFGSGWNGSVLAPLNPALRGEPLRHQLRRAAPELVIFDRTTAAQLKAALDHAGQPARPVPVLLETDPIDGPPPPLDSDTATWLEGVARFRLAPTPAPLQPSLPSDPAAVLFTSGTTGPAKGVVLPHGQLWWWAVIGSEELALRPDDVLYTNLPLFHTNALTTPLQALAGGARAVVGPHFSVSAFWDRLTDSGATVTFILGAMSAMLWNRRPEDFDHTRTTRLRTILAPGVDPALKPQFERFFGVQLVEGFGMTEIGVPLYTPVSHRTAGVVGVAHPDYEVALLGPDGTVVEGAGVGELAVRPRQPSLISSGYLGDPEATLASRRDLWFLTGDLVARSADGVYQWRDRLKDSIRRRGENISSHDVEQAVRRHPSVADAAAVAVPSDLGEDEVLVVVQLSPGCSFDPEEVLATAGEHLAPFALPSFVRVVDTMPLTSTGKVAKAVLREAGVTAGTWRR